MPRGWLTYMGTPEIKIFTTAIMRILAVLASFIALKLFSCAEVSLNLQPEAKNEFKSEPLRLDNLSTDLLHKISSYLENPFLSMGYLNHYFQDLFSKTFSPKRIFKERFDIPSLNIEDVDDDEKELKRLLNYSNFADSDFIYKAFEHEFLRGNKIKVLNSPLLNYLYPDNNAILINGHDLNDDDDDEDDEIHSLDEGEYLIFDLIDAKKYEFLFRDEAVLFPKFVKSVIFGHESIQNLQEYILSNPKHLGHVHSYFHSLIDKGKNDDIIEKWVCIALASNMPDWLFNGFPTHLFSTLDSEVFWTGIYIPKHLYNELFGRVNTIIGHIFTGSNLKFYSLLNAIRFGPEDSELYEPIMSLHP